MLRCSPSGCSAANALSGCNRKERRATRPAGDSRGERRDGAPLRALRSPYLLGNPDRERAMPFVIAYFVVGILFGILAQATMRNKSRSAASGFWLGFLFGPVGWLIVGMLVPDYRARDEAAAVAK